MTSNIKFRYTDNLQKTYTENLVANPAQINVNIDSDTALAVDSFVRSIMALTKNTYKDVTIEQTAPITDLIEEG